MVSKLDFWTEPQNLEQQTRKMGHNFEFTGCFTHLNFIVLISMNEELGDDLIWEELMGEDIMVKRIINGTGESADMGTVVNCDLKGYFVTNCKCELEPFEVLKSQRFKIGESDAVPGLELALRHSRQGEILRVRFKSKFGYGFAGRPALIIPCMPVNKEQMVKSDDVVNESLNNKDSSNCVPSIPADTDLEYQIQVLSHLPEGAIDPILLEANNTDICKVIDTGNASQRQMDRLSALTELHQRKEAGNRWFSYQDYARAARAYSKGTKVADQYFNGAAAQEGNSCNSGDIVKDAISAEMNKDEGETSHNAVAAAVAEAESKKRQFEAGDENIVAVYVSCLNNIAACQLKLGEPAKAKDLCIRVLEIDPVNQKALLRAAKAALATHNFEECDACLQQLLKITTPGSTAAIAALSEQRKLKLAQKEYRLQSKNMAANMSRKLFPTNSNNTNTVTASNTTIIDDATAAAPPSAIELAKQPLGAATTNVVSSKAKSSDFADHSLLLLLLTSVFVLAVSAVMVFYANTTTMNSSGSNDGNGADLL